MKLLRTAISLAMLTLNMTSFAVEMTDDEYCNTVVKPLELEFSETGLWIVPNAPIAGERIYICEISLLLADRTNVAVVNNRVHMTIYDSGWDWLPNPISVFGTHVDGLPAGNYLLDVSVEAGWAPAPSYYPYTVENNVPVIVKTDKIFSGSFE